MNERVAPAWRFGDGGGFPTATPEAAATLLRRTASRVRFGADFRIHHGLRTGNRGGSFRRPLRITFCTYECLPRQAPGKTEWCLAVMHTFSARVYLLYDLAVRIRFGVNFRLHHGLRTGNRGFTFRRPLRITYACA